MRIYYIIITMDMNLNAITHQEVTPELLALFDITKPTMPRAFNVLEGLNREHILIDDPVRPSSADEQLFPRSFDYQSTLDLFGNVENVLRHTLGVVILHGDTLVCEATTGAPTNRWIEAGVTTAEPFRRQGLASIACARLIELCEEKGYHTWWDCAKQNTPSVKLAKKLG